MADDDDSFGSLIDKIHASPLASHATEIGFLCIFWSRLELETSLLLFQLMQPVGDYEATITITNMDFREKIAAILALGFHKRPDDAWFASLKQKLNDVDNDLRPARNRFVHDHWLQVGDEVIKFTMKTGVYYEQARTLALKLYEIQTLSPAKILILSIKVLSASGALMSLRQQLPPLPDTPSRPLP